MRGRPVRDEFRVSRNPPPSPFETSHHHRHIRFDQLLTSFTSIGQVLRVLHFHFALFSVVVRSSWNSNPGVPVSHCRVALLLADAYCASPEVPRILSWSEHLNPPALSIVILSEHWDFNPSSDPTLFPHDVGFPWIRACWARSQIVKMFCLWAFADPNSFLLAGFDDVLCPSRICCG